MAYFALLKLHILPHDFLSLPENEMAFVLAAFEIHMKEVKKAQKKAKEK